jgi:hypothetical protein
MSAPDSDGEELSPHEQVLDKAAKRIAELSEQIRKLHQEREHYLRLHRDSLPFRRK